MPSASSPADRVSVKPGLIRFGSLRAPAGRPHRVGAPPSVVEIVQTSDVVEGETRGRSHSGATAEIVDSISVADWPGGCLLRN